MKHLKIWNQLNELHSDTYYSAGRKYKEIYGNGNYLSDEFFEKGDIQLAKEENVMSDKEQTEMDRKFLRKNAVMFLKYLKKEIPEFLIKLEIKNWKDIIFIFVNNSRKREILAMLANDNDMYKIFFGSPYYNEINYLIYTIK